MVKFKILIASVVLLLSSYVMAIPSDSAEIVPIYYKQLTLKQLKPNLYSLVGRMEEDDCKRIKSDLPTEGKFTVILESSGGSLKAGLCLSKYLKELDVRTIVTDVPVVSDEGFILYNPGYNTKASDREAKKGKKRKVICASACSLLFLGGDSRLLMGDVYLGIHSPRTVNPTGTYRQGEANAYQTAAYLMWFLKNTLLVEDGDLRTFFITVPASEMYYLRQEHFKRSPWLKKLATDYINFRGYTNLN